MKQIKEIEMRDVGRGQVSLTPLQEKMQEIAKMVAKRISYKKVQDE